MWQFHFLHPKGGRGTIQIHLTPAGAKARATTVGHWYIDDNQAHTRMSLSQGLIAMEEVEQENLIRFLEAALSRLLGLERSSLTRTSRIAPRQRDKDGGIMFAEFELAQRLPT